MKKGDQVFSSPDPVNVMITPFRHVLAGTKNWQMKRREV